MTQIETGLYKSIADAYAAIDVALSGVGENARIALDAIVDVDTTTYPDPSANADAALEIELALLSTFASSWRAAQNISNSVGSLLDAVRAVNNHVIANNIITGTTKAKMDDWINTQMNDTWTTECPVGWANLCIDAGYDTTDWVTA